jgi:predicted kinase
MRPSEILAGARISFDREQTMWTVAGCAAIHTYMLQVYAMCRLAFSGKSTLARRIADELSIPLISLDAINHERGLRGGEGMSIAQWEETSATAMDRLRRRLGEGELAVVDDTFSRRFLRDRCKAVALEFGAGFTVVLVDTPIDEIRARRDANYRHPTRHHVRDDIFEDHYRSFQFPAADEPVVRVTDRFDQGAWLNEQAARL